MRLEQQARRVAQKPAPIDTALNQFQAVVVLGDPSSGKSTLLKILVLSLVREVDRPLPILVPLNAYADELSRGGPISLHEFLPKYFAVRQGSLRDLAPLFELALAQEQAVILLHG